MKKSELRQIIREELSKIQESSDLFFYKIQYIVDSTTFGSPLEVLKTTLHFAAAKDKIHSNYRIEYEGTKRGIHFGDTDKVFLIKTYSNLPKSELQKYFDEHSISSETYKIL